MSRVKLTLSAIVGLSLVVVALLALTGSASAARAVPLAGASATGGSPVVEAAAPATAFYFAEGTTRTNYQEYLCMGNSGDQAANAKVTYLFTDGTTKDANYTVPANSRHTVDVNSVVGPNKDLSLKVLSDSPNLVAERPMYFNYNGVWTGGSDAVGATAPNTKWYFAEGNTLPEFDQYVAVLNPGNTAANLKFHYMVEGQGEKLVTGQVGPHSRKTFKTRDQIGDGKNESLYLESDQPVVAERPMYFNYQGLAQNNWTGGHDVVGTNSPNTNWYFAEGTTRKNSVDGAFEQWLCLQNPGTKPITVTATYQLAAGQGNPVSKSYTVPAQQRLTVSVNKEIGADKDDSVFLTSTSLFIAERPMYFSYHASAWTGGHDVLGVHSTATTWFFAEGTTRSNFEEWLCLQNPGNSDAHTTVTYYTTSGQAINKSWTVKANTRLTVSANSDVGANQDISTRVSSDKPIIVERPMYFNFQGVWTGGHDVVGASSTPKITVTGISAITGTPQVRQLLTAGALTPAGATATYQWQESDIVGGTYTDIGGATSNTYTLVTGDMGKFIKVKATGTGNNTGTVTSAPTTAIATNQLTISDPTLTTTKPYDGTTTAAVTAGTLSGVIAPDAVTVSAAADYDTAAVGTGKTITVVYTLGGADAGNYLAPVNYTNNTGVITALIAYEITVSAPTNVNGTNSISGTANTDDPTGVYSTGDTCTVTAARPDAVVGSGTTGWTWLGWYSSTSSGGTYTLVPGTNTLTAPYTYAFSVTSNLWLQARYRINTIYDNGTEYLSIVPGFTSDDKCTQNKDSNVLYLNSQSAYFNANQISYATNSTIDTNSTEGFGKVVSIDVYWKNTGSNYDPNQAYFGTADVNIGSNGGRYDDNDVRNSVGTMKKKWDYTGTAQRLTLSNWSVSQQVVRIHSRADFNISGGYTSEVTVTKITVNY